MTEYIDREDLVKHLDILYNRLCGKSPHFYCGFLTVLDYVKYFSTADVEPVVHGRWIIGVDDDDFDVKCSKCEWTAIFEVAGIDAVKRIAKTMRHCPHCGAKMNGSDNNG